MSVPVTTTFATPDANTKFSTVTALVALLNTLVASVIPSTLTTYVKSTASPSVADQDKIWIRLDATGSPLGTYVFRSGLWVRERPTPGAGIGFYTGDPVIDFDGSGKGLAGAGPVAKDLYGWALANGQNGTANLSNQFIIAGGMDNSGFTGYSGGLWRTNVEGTPKNQGGTKTPITLTPAMVPSPAVPAVHVTRWTADGNTKSSTGTLYGQDGTGGTTIDLIPADPGNLTPTALPLTIPPYYAMAIITWIGYP